MHPPASDDAVLLEHLQLANQQLRAVLADAGCSLPELPLPADPQQLQEDEVMALLAEENYQLRQLWQQLQQQQQLEELEQQLVLQHELEVNRGALEFDRFSPSFEQESDCSPVAATRLAPRGTLFGSPAALDTNRGWLSPAHAAAGVAMSPAAARLVHAPSLNTVQLVEAEAAAQLATQAAIQAEAEAYHHMPWQQLQPLQTVAGSRDPAHYTGDVHHFPAHSTDHSPVGSCSFDDMHQQMDNQQEQVQRAHLSSTTGSRMALPQLPQLSLPRHLIARRSQESTCSDVGRSSVASAASGDLTWRSHATAGTSQQPLSATAAAASARSNASSSCSGLKQLANDLLLLPPDLRVLVPGTGLEASQLTFGPSPQDSFSDHGRPLAAAKLQSQGMGQYGARECGVDQAHKAAGLAADAAAGIWYPSATRGGSDGTSDVHTQDQRHQQHQQQDWQQQQPRTSTGLQSHMPLLPPISTSTRRSGSWGLPPTSPAQPRSGAVSQAAAAATALASQAFCWQQSPPQAQQQQPLPALRLPPRVQTFAQQQSPPQEYQPQQQLLPMLSLPARVQTLAQQQSPSEPLQQQQQLSPLPALRLPARVQTLAQVQQQSCSLSSSEGEGQFVDDGPLPEIPPSLPRLRLPGHQHAAKAAGAGNAAAATVLQTHAAGSDSYSSSPEDSPLSDSAFFRAAGGALFDGSSSNCLLDAGTDLFGARISMDDAGLGLSCSEAQPSQLPDVPEDYFGLPDSSGSADGPAGSSYCMSQQGGWLGVSYQSQQYLRTAQHSGGSLGRSSQEQHPLYNAAAAGTSADAGGYGGRLRRRSMGQSVVAGTIDELSELIDADFGDMTLSRHENRGSTGSGSGFVATAAAGLMSGLTSAATSQQVSFTANVSRQPSVAAHAAAAGAQQQQQQQDELLAFPNLAPLRVLTGRQQEQTPPMTWQPQPLRTDSSSSARSMVSRTPSATATAAAVAAATSPAHMAATVAAEAAASVGLAAAATGGLDSQQLQQLLHHLARVAEEASSNVTASAAAAATAVTPGRAVSAPAGAVAGSPAAAVRCGQPAGAQQDPPLGSPQGQQQQQQQATAVDDADCFTPVARPAVHQQQQQVLTSGQPGAPLSPFAAAGVHSPARPAANSCLVMSPQAPALLRTLSAGQMAEVAAAAGAAGLPPKWASRSSSNTNLAGLHVQVTSPQRSLQQQRQGHDDLAGQTDQQQQQPCVATAVPCATATAAPERGAAAPAGSTSMVSPRLGLHGRLRVITHAGAGAGGYSSNGSNSDAEPGSAHTTPMHKPSQQGSGALAVRAGSGTSFSRPAGLTSITVPPSPASSGVRYVPASPRVVGFDCPLTPHAYALRSPSWRSDAGAEGSSVGGHSGLACCSGASTPRRQASSPGLLQQALARSGMASQQHHSQPQLAASSGTSAAGSSCNTPSAAGAAARRAGSTGQVIIRPGLSEAATAGGFTAATAAHAGHVAGHGSDRHAGGSHSNGAGLLRHGSCSSSALLLTMMGGQVPVLHPHRTASSPFLDALQSPGTARRYRSSGAAGFDPAGEAVVEQGASDPAAAAADPHPDPAFAQAAGPGSRSSGGSHRSSSDSGSGTSSPLAQEGAGDALSAVADCGAPGHEVAVPADAPGAATLPPRSVAVAADDTAAAAAVDVTLGVSASVSSQLAAQCSRSVSPQPPHVTSPQAHAAQAAADAGGQHKLSRFGLAAARASSEKPLAELGSKGTDLEGLADVVPQQGLTAIVMTCRQARDGDEADAAVGSACSGSNCGSSSSQGHGNGLVEVVSLAAGVGVVVPDTPALEATAEGAAFAAQHSPNQQLPAGATGSLAAALIEQELLLQQPTTGDAAADLACTSGAGVPEAGSSSSRRQQRVSWAPHGASGSSDHHPPPASPCTPQQDAEQQQLQSPEKQQDMLHQPQQDIWQHLQEQQQQAPDGPGPLRVPATGCQGSLRTDRTLPRCKSAAADLAGGRHTAAAAAAAAPHATSDAGTPDAAAAAAAAAASGMWSPTHDVRGISSRHRSPSALLMRLSQRQVDVLEAKGRATSTVPYVLPHRSSNPASALRALTTKDCSSISSADKPPHGPSAPTGSTPRSSLQLYSSTGGTHGVAALQPAASWDLEQVQPPEDLLALASVPAAIDVETYIPLPTTDSAAAAEAAQQRQQQQHLGGVRCGGVDVGQADAMEGLLDAAIVRQRPNSSSKWLGPAPVVAASAAAAEAEAAAVLSRRRSSQAEPDSPAPLPACSQDSSRGIVAMTAAALAAAAADTQRGPGSQTGRLCGGSRIAKAAAALAASSADASAVQDLVRVPAKLRPRDAWLAATAASVGADSAEASAARGRWQQQQQGAPDSSSNGACSAAVLHGLPSGQQQQQVTTAGACGPEAGAMAVGSRSQPVEQACNSPTSAQPSGAPAAATTCGLAPVVRSGDDVGSSPFELAASSNTGDNVAAKPNGQAATASTGAVADVEGSSDCADSAAARQQLQPGCAGDAADAADACVLPACVRDHQQQLLQQRQAMRAQLQRKRDEVAAWARVQRTQAQLATEGVPPAAVVGTLASSADVADVAGRRGADQAGRPDAASATAVDLSCYEARSLGTTIRNGVCPAEHKPGTFPTVVWEGPSPAGVAQVVPATPAAALLLGGDDLAGPGFEAAGGLGPSGLQRSASAALSIADDFSDVQSWAAWSTTSSINRCPKLEWWGAGAGQGRFSHKQPRQAQRTLSAPVGGSSQAGWWQRLLQRLLQRRRQEGVRASVDGDGVGTGQGRTL